MKKEITLWNSEINEEYLQSLQEDYPDDDEYSIMEIAMEDNYFNLQNLRKSTEFTVGDIIVIADLGLWSGRKQGYKMLNDRLSSCFYDDNDYVEWRVDKLGDLCSTSSHHDGTNYYLYRAFKDNVSEERRDTFRAKIYNGTVTRRDITNYTRSLGQLVLDNY